MRKQIAAANWKMNLTLQEGTQLLNDIILSDGFPDAPHQMAMFGVPFPYLPMAVEKLAGKQNVLVAAQNCHTKNAGAYTGEVSAAMLQSLGVQAVILGHSERREYNNETDAEIAEKVNSALAHNLVPVFCCGEALSVREAGNQNQWVEQQLAGSLFHLDEAAIQKIVIAYEPIWAIGTGKTATAEQAQQMHAFIRSVLAAKFGETIAANIPVLYGGSVKGANAQEIFSQPDVDGGLVGGASLVATEFTTIMNSLK
ncbi:MAG: triose-phosphate isomerase [Dinghuibacter sp.]|nr:triose-phosphate isomerase [Dinghuibacter sp.]